MFGVNEIGRFDCRPVLPVRMELAQAETGRGSNEKGIPIDEGVFLPILRVQQTDIGSKVTFDKDNQKAYDDFKATKH